MKVFEQIKFYKKLYVKCKASNSNFVLTFLRGFFIKLFYTKEIWMHNKTTIKNINNIEINGRLFIGLNYVGFVNNTDSTFLNVKGKMQIEGDYIISRGCRIDIGENAILKIGKNGYVMPNTTFIVMNKVVIGDNCAISWDCQFLDDDLHQINYEGKKESKSEIIIGDRVWIGCGVKIYKGSVIPNDTVIASNSVVRGVFNLKNTIIAGHPAKVIKEKVTWK